MFERLAGKILDRLLSKYFVQNINDKKSSNLSVWSGYISFDNMELRPEVVNEIFHSKGIAVELVSGSIRSLEITVPWAQLGLGSSSATPNEDDSGVVVVVLDGVHILLKTNYGYNDEALRREAISSRRSKLGDSEAFGKDKDGGSFSQYLHKRITEGLIKDIMEKLHVHVRDVHIRLEDVKSSPSNPYACGLTLESFHVQADEEDYTKEQQHGVIRKEGQLNHFAVYWNAIDDSEDMPVELSILHQQGLSPASLAKALNKCIDRRASALASPIRTGGDAHVAKHTYLLRPVDATCNAALSTEPKNLQARPIFVASIIVDDLSLHVRDFQGAGASCLASSLKEHSFLKQYRPYRPQVSASEDPKAWWHYAARVVRMELRESRMRWSWSRFHQRYELRRRYCNLYERHQRYPSTNGDARSRSVTPERRTEARGMGRSPSMQSLSALLETHNSKQRSAPDAGAGPSADLAIIPGRGRGSPPPQSPALALTQAEYSEMREMEDGLRGDLSIRDIVLYRAIVNARLAGITQASKKKSVVRRWMRSVASEDTESEREYERLIKYLDSASKGADLDSDDETKSLVAVSVRAQLGRGCISLYSPLAFTTDQKQHRRLHERFMDISIKTFFTEMDLMGNFESYQLTVSLDNFSTTELRSNKKEYVVLSRVQALNDESMEETGFDKPLIYLQMTSNPPDHTEYDIGFHANLDAVEVDLTPDCEWIHRIQDLVPHKEDKVSSKSFWENVSLAQLSNVTVDRAGWVARATRGLGDHKNLDLDVRINCPKLHFSGDRACTLRVDLGMAHLVTESLAGVAIGKLNYAYKDTRQHDRDDTASQSGHSSSQLRSTHVTSTTGVSDSDVASLQLIPSLDSQTMMSFPSSPKSRLGMDPFYVGASSASVMGSEARGFSGKSLFSGANKGPRSDARDVHSSFYDKFQIRLSEMKIDLLERVEDKHERLLSDVDIGVLVEASVIPSDHSLCRFKVKAAVEDFDVSLTQANALEIGKIVSAWKESMSRERNTPSAFLPTGVDRTFRLHLDLMTEIEGQEEQDVLSDNSSDIDENEFLDVFEDDGEAWAEESWAPDAESVINGSAQSPRSSKKKRRARSVSDVSSISDGSQQMASKVNTSAAYLNAENLAMLEEGGGEEDDDESDLESDDDSFHSAISFGGRLELANTLLEDIASAESDVARLQKQLSDLTQSDNTTTVMTPDVSKKRRQGRIALKVALDRAVAELRALKASHHDLEQSVEINVEGDDPLDFAEESRSVGSKERGQGKEDIAAKRAQSILLYRRRKTVSDLNGDAADQEAQTGVIRQELFQGTFVVRSLSLKLESDNRVNELPSLCLQLSQLALVVSHRTRGSKLFLGTDFVCLSQVDNGKQQDLIRGGGPMMTNLMSRSAPTQGDRFVRLAFDMNRGKSGISSKGRLFFGSIEVSPEASLLSTAAAISGAIPKSSSKVPPVSGDKSTFVDTINDSLESLKKKSIQQPLLHDFSIRCASLRMRLWDDTHPVGASTLTDSGLRVSLEIASQTARFQLDTMCGNIQLYDYGDEAGFVPKELFGRRDHYGQIVRGRVRVHVAPQSRLDGWAVGRLGSRLVGGTDHLVVDEMAVDCHVGFRVQPIQIIPYKESLARLMRVRTTPSESRPEVVTSRESSAVPIDKLRVRWRTDFALQKVSIVIPSAADNSPDSVAKSPDSALQLILSFRLCAQPSGSRPAVQAALHDITVVRTLDDWPILERTSISLEASLNLPLFACPSGPLLERLEPPSESFWYESASVLQEYMLAGTTCGQMNGKRLHASFAASPVRLNASSSIISLMMKTLSSYSGVIVTKEVGQDSSRRDSQLPFNGGVHSTLSATDVEIKLFKDVSSTTRSGIAYAKPLFSVSSRGWLLDMSGEHNTVKVSVCLGNFMVHDLTVHPGVRAVGLSHGVENGQNDDFLSLNVELHMCSSVPILDIHLKWGRIQLLVLPSLLESVLSVVKGMPKQANQEPQKTPASNSKAVAWGSCLLSIFVETDGFDCILSSKNIFDHVRDDSGASINVVIFRWVSSLQGTVAFVKPPEAAEVTPQPSSGAPNALFQEQLNVVDTLSRFADDQLRTLVLLNSDDESDKMDKNSQRSVASVHFKLGVTEFQALRTCVDRVRTSMSAAGDSGDTPAVFAVTPPTAGEQRITNPINFSANYRLLGTSVGTADATSPLDSMELTQAFDLDADMVDVLVYNRQSAGGMNDTLRVTVKPILSMLNDSQRSTKETAPSSNDGEAASQVKEAFQRATTIGSARIKGFQVTMVPGGATRLTESPIIQFVMKNFKVGGAAIDVPANFEPDFSPKATSLLGISGALRGSQAVNGADRASQSMLSNLTVAGWICVDISAHYHNRRLVAWEPLIEEWTANASLGIDLVRVLNLAPTVRTDAALLTTARAPSSGSNFTPDAGFRRLFGSFAPKQSSSEIGSVMRTPSDMPYLLLISMAPSMISSALHPLVPKTINVQQETHQRSVTKIPGLRRFDWMRQFGHPCSVGKKKSPALVPAIQFSFSDNKPLNINVTGALIENVATYLTGASAIIPHWIRNDTGLTIRFFEVLDFDRVKHGEQPQPTTLASGREIPLSLKRALSQSCDPHRAQIVLELGSFEETVDRVNHSKYKVSKGSRSSTYFYKAVGRIPVDTVGLHEISFYENTSLLSDSVNKATEAVGKIIVRISLKGDKKMVSIESPMLLRNASDQVLHCQVRDRNDISLLWSSQILGVHADDGKIARQCPAVPIPADLVPSIDRAASNLSLSTLPSNSNNISGVDSVSTRCLVNPPLPYSRSSIARGIISERELSLSVNSNDQIPMEDRGRPFVYLSACSLRVGSADATSSRVRAGTKKPDTSVVPQQRMLLLRPPLVVANHLPVLMRVQVRSKDQPARLTQASSSSNLIGLNASDSQIEVNDSRERLVQIGDAWTDLGVIGCGKSVCWTGAQSSQEVELKVKLMDVRDSSAEKFPDWSTAFMVLPDSESSRMKETDGNSSSVTVLDEAGNPLTLSIHVDLGLHVQDHEDSGIDDVRSFSTVVDQAPRVVSVSVPYWIVDSSGSELEFLANRPIAGQSCNWSQSTIEKSLIGESHSLSSLGLAELMEGETDSDSTQGAFDILMIGDERASRLTLRQRRSRLRRDSHRMSQSEAPWCEPVALNNAEGTFTDVDVFPPSEVEDDDPSEPLALRSEIVKAPMKCGGSQGTKIVHIVNRYKIVNEMGRDLELMAGHGRGEAIIIHASGLPVPYHFNDSSPIRFRPKEFGWLWSGKISVLKKRREVAVRLIHKLRGQVIIASVECLANSKSPSTILIFRNATQPPFRLENHTMYAFRYGQSSHFVTDEENQNWQRNDLSLDSTLLPYQHADFAWDEPDEGRRSVSIELGDAAHHGQQSLMTDSRILGTFALEKIAPGSNLRLSGRDFAGKIVADGPTRVLRITDAHLPLSSPEGTVDPNTNAFSKREGALSVPSWISLKLSHGIGISVVDWTPQELLYISIDDVILERNVDDSHEHVSASIGHLAVDNQLWVTPYPVLLKLGRKQGKRRRSRAVELGWTRELAKQGGIMLLSNLELSAEPITIRVDGAVVNELLNMLLDSLEYKSMNVTQQKHWLESEVRKVLKLDDISQPTRRAIQNNAIGTYMAEDFAATAAVASKIRLGSRSQATGAPTISRGEPRKELPAHRQDQRKVYIDRLKISNIKTELSWTGALPTFFVGLPKILRPALTFESLPVSLRSFTSYHVYGTSQDVTDDLKQHYLSVWRVVDVLFGLTFKPTFLIHACVYTSTEFVASLLDTISQWCTNAEDALLHYMPTKSSSSSLTPTKRRGQEPVSRLFQATLGKPTLLMASSYRTWAVLTSSMASSLRYREPREAFAVRSRNPRLFAHVDGKDILVRYVEGENAGKALLSRVRAGQHLVEGYVFHTEKVHLQTSKGTNRDEGTNSTPLILMVTSERVLLLNGERKANFCQVIWEVLFQNMVCIELDDADGAYFLPTKFWYLVDTEQSKGNAVDRLNRFAHAVVGDSDMGLGMLLCKALYIPQDCVKTFRVKVASIYKGIGQQ